MGAGLREVAKDVTNVQKLECLALPLQMRWGMRGRGLSSTTLQDEAH